VTPPAALTISGRAISGLIALSLLFFVITAGTFTALGAVLPDMVSSLHWSWAAAGLGYTILGAACGLASYAPAVLIRAVGVRITILLGAGVMAVGFACLTLTRTLPLYWGGAGLLGIGFALCATIPATYVLSRSFNHASAAFGVYFTAGALGGAGGPLLYVATKAAETDWRDFWILCAILVLVSGALAAFLVRGGEANPGKSKASAIVDADTAAFSVAQALATPQFWIITLAYTTYLVCETSVNGLSIAHLVHRGVAPAVAGGMLGLQALVNAAARAAGGVLGERIKPRTLVIGALALTALGILALAAARGYPLMLTYVIGVGVGYGVSYLATILLLLNYFGRRWNLELFSIMCLISTVAAGGPWLAGALRDQFGGFEGAFFLFAGLAGVALVAVVFMRPPTLPGHASTMAETRRP